MSAALVTIASVSIIGLGASIVLGHVAATSAELVRHVTLSVFVTLLALLSHSLVMFYLIGKGRAIREAVVEHRLDRRFVEEVSAARRPVFSIGTLAIAVTMATAIVGGGVDTGVLPTGLHVVLAYSALAVNVATLRVELVALAASARIVTTINESLSRPPSEGQPRGA